MVTLVGQRVSPVALGYDDLNDHNELRHDPMMAVLAGKLEAPEDCAPVAGKSTLKRVELSKLGRRAITRSVTHLAIKRLLVDVFLEAHKGAPNEIILDLDATDDPVRGNQDGRFFHGYYNYYCYLPLYIFCGHHLLAGKLRRASVDAADGAVEEVAGWNYSNNSASPGVTPKLVRKTSTTRLANQRFWLRRNSIDIVPTIGTALSTRELEPHPSLSRRRSASERSRTCDEGPRHSRRCEKKGGNKNCPTDFAVRWPNRLR
jgi:hypothetical protein